MILKIQEFHLVQGEQQISRSMTEKGFLPPEWILETEASI